MRVLELELRRICHPSKLNAALCTILTPHEGDRRKEVERMLVSESPPLGKKLLLHMSHYVPPHHPHYHHVCQRARMRG